MGTSIETVYLENQFVNMFQETFITIHKFDTIISFQGVYAKEIIRMIKCYMQVSSPQHYI